ncbi:hypothetical protein ONE63_011553 [Megalurothrips usitatus]|uniref:Retrotransposon gag domain-containing protein n=1 Tax=Megalurothrips usitatus TaxID=439358 RepID=A0AAV7WZM9_9NEOP|nr:hypothetical protein ONE63_011553 [Megalurothrips usitatus]
MRKLDRYNGQTDYTLYRMQFLQRASLMHWNEETKGTQLSQALTDKALEVLRHLHPRQMQDFEALDSALMRRFGAVSDHNACRAKLKYLKQKGSQTLEAYASEIEDAVRGAFREYPEHLQQLQMVTAFNDGLLDATMALLLAREKHRTLDSVLASARVQPLQMLEKGKQARVHAGRALAGDGEEWERELPQDRVDVAVAALNSMTGEVANMAERQEKLLQQTAAKNQPGPRRSPPRGHPPPDRVRDQAKAKMCFYCGKPRHFAAACLKRKRDNAKGIDKPVTPYPKWWKGASGQKEGQGDSRSKN